MSAPARAAQRQRPRAAHPAAPVPSAVTPRTARPDRLDLGALDPAGLAAAVLATAGTALGGARARGDHPVLQAWAAQVLELSARADALAGAPPRPVRRLPLGATPDRVSGGLDLAASLQARRPVLLPGLLAEADGGWVVLPCAERIDPAVAHAVCAALDGGTSAALRDGLGDTCAARVAVLALDEGGDDDEATTDAALDERLGLRLVLDPRAPILPPRAEAVVGARRRLPAVRLSARQWGEVSARALRAGRLSLRAARFCALVARTVCALEGRRRVAGVDLDLAAALTLGLAPDAATETAPPDAADAPPPPRSDRDPTDAAPDAAAPEAQSERRVAPATAPAELPAGLLEALARQALAASPARGRRRRAAAPSTASPRGAPAGSRPAPRARRNLDLAATLKAAAPWQALRTAEIGAASTGCAVHVRGSDLRQRVRRPGARTTAIFVVDASGSAAVQRLAEAKGAVERLLADCYARRDQVALVQFRGASAEVVLPPTRAIARARRRLADTPAGGATPLAAGLQAGAALALQSRKRGEAPLLVVLTDARANIDRHGQPGRAEAARDALDAAARIAEARLDALTIDISPRGEPQARRLAETLAGRYLHLPGGAAEAMAAEVAGARRAATGGRA